MEITNVAAVRTRHGKQHRITVTIEVDGQQLVKVLGGARCARAVAVGVLVWRSTYDGTLQANCSVRSTISGAESFAASGAANGYASTWAAHRIDGNPSAGWVPAHRACNERAKDRRATA